MANCNCGNVYNVGMGCCEPVLGPIENYYTKYQVDKLISGITVSGVTEEEMNEAISAATDGLASEEYVNNQISSQTADFVDGEELSSYTYDKATIDFKIASGGTFDPTKYYTKSETSGATQIQDALNIISGSIPAITSAVTSGSTACVTSGGVYDALQNIPNIWCGTQAEYDLISPKDPNTLYLIHS